jgi:hypothetical protein
MGKINKNSNLYDKDGNLLRHVNEDGLLKDMKIKEVQDLVDELGTQKDERGNLIKPREFNNASSILMQMYNDPKNIKERNELVSQLINKSKINKEEVTKSLKETEEELVKPAPSYDVNTNNDEYIEPIPA